MEYLEYLQKLNDEIKSLPVDDKKRLELICNYNSKLDDILPFLKKPLPEACELLDSLILDEYKEFKEYFKKNGYYSFEKFIRDVDLIAEVRIKKVKQEGTVIHAEVIKLYKGHTTSIFMFYSSESWKPPKWFQVKETCLVFLFRRKSSNEYFGYSLHNKMPIIMKGGKKYIICYDCEPEFWENTRINVLSKDLGCGTASEVQYEDVVNILKANTDM